MEFSKKVLVISWIVALILTIATIITIFLGFSATDIEILAGISWGEVTASNAVYFWKARSENRAKYAQEWIDKLADKYGIESITNVLSNVVFKD